MIALKCTNWMNRLNDWIVGFSESVNFHICFQIFILILSAFLLCAWLEISINFFVCYFSQLNFPIHKRYLNFFSVGKIISHPASQSTIHSIRIYCLASLSKCVWHLQNKAKHRNHSWIGAKLILMLNRFFATIIHSFSLCVSAYALHGMNGL